jgi:hypothetical protein
MDVILSLAAEVPVCFAGLGICLFVVPTDHKGSIIELLAISILLGTASQTVAWLISDLLLPLIDPWLVVTPILIVIGSIGCLSGLARGIRLQHPGPPNLPQTVGVLLLVLAVGFGGWLIFNTSLGYDGLFVWEFKARTVCLSGGQVPLTSFSDSTRVWSHLDYPLLVPLNEAWIDQWIHRCDQSLVKIVNLAFLAAGIALLYASGSCLGGNQIRGFAAAALPFFVPFLVVGEGSASSGFVDFTLAVYYLAAVSYLMPTTAVAEGWRSVMPGALLAVILPWVKHEGTLLWLILLFILATVYLPKRRSQVILGWGLPGVLAIVAWNAFLRGVSVIPSTDFLPVSPGILVANLPRLPVIWTWLSSDLRDWNRWGLLWPAFLLALLTPGSTTSRRIRVVTAMAVVLPLAAFELSYVFSAWVPFVNHIRASLPRLELQTSLVAILEIAVSIPVPHDLPGGGLAPRDTIPVRLPSPVRLPPLRL